MARVRKNQNRWEALGLPDWAMDAVDSMGFVQPTPAQAAAVPLFTGNCDVVLEAPTGSGKTLAFLLPLVARILRRFGSSVDDDGDPVPPTPIPRGHVVAIIVAPTRELADQLYRVLLELAAFHPATAAILPYVEKRGAAAASAGAAAKADKKTPLAADGQQIVGDHPEDDEDDDEDGTKTRDYTTLRRPQTAEPVLVPQLVLGGEQCTPVEDVQRFVRQGTNVLVGTPGRLAQLLERRTLNARDSFEALVLDEADRLLEMGMGHDLWRIIGFVPKQRRTFLCSATVTDAIAELVKVNLRNARRVIVQTQTRKEAVPAAATAAAAATTTTTTAPAPAEPVEFDQKKTPMSLVNTYTVLPPSLKLPALLQILRHIEPRPQRTLVFFATCLSVKYFAAVLPKAFPSGYTVLALHGKMESKARVKTYARFRAETKPCVLFSTDLASRGLDVADLDLVINIDPPTDSKTFLHRIGRTGRAGRRGLAITMLRPGREADHYVSFLGLRKTPVEPLGRAMPSLAHVFGARGNAADAADATADGATAAAASADAAAAVVSTAALTKKIRAQVWADRALHVLGQRAFVSWARSFQAHQTDSIFRATDLDWVEIGHAWGLVQLPKMPELRQANITDRSLGLDDGSPCAVDDIPFRDRAKEAQRLRERRQRELAAAAKAAGEDSDGSGDDKDKDNDDGDDDEDEEARRKRKRNNGAGAWSERRDRDGLRSERREKRHRRRDAERRALLTPEELAKEKDVAALVAEVRRRNLAAAEEAGGGGGGGKDSSNGGTAGAKSNSSGSSRRRREATATPEDDDDDEDDDLDDLDDLDSDDGSAHGRRKAKKLKRGAAGPVLGGLGDEDDEFNGFSD